MLPTYNLAGVIFSISYHYNHADLWNIWNWKLSPYSIPSRTETSILINGSGRMTAPSFGSLIHSDNSGFFLKNVYKLNDSTLWVYTRKKNRKAVLVYRVSSSWDTITLIEDNSNTTGMLAFEYLSQIMPSVMLKHDYLTFHGVLMEYEGNGIIISAASGTGKTTHARLWRDLRRALIINGDRAVCAKTAEGWTGCGLPWSGTSGEQINRSVAIRALVVLRRGETNEAHRISALEAFHQVFAHVLYPSWDKALAEKMMDLLESFLRDVPIFLLSCRPDAESVDMLHAALAEVLHE